jgi:hypothetical protein
MEKIRLFLLFLFFARLIFSSIFAEISLKDIFAVGRGTIQLKMLSQAVAEIILCGD